MCSSMVKHSCVKSPVSKNKTKNTESGQKPRGNGLWEKWGGGYIRHVAVSNQKTVRPAVCGQNWKSQSGVLSWQVCWQRNNALQVTSGQAPPTGRPGKVWLTHEQDSWSSHQCLVNTGSESLSHLPWWPREGGGANPGQSMWFQVTHTSSATRVRWQSSLKPTVNHLQTKCAQAGNHLKS